MHNFIFLHFFVLPNLHFWKSLWKEINYFLNFIFEIIRWSTKTKRTYSFVLQFINSKTSICLHMRSTDNYSLSHSATDKENNWFLNHSSQQDMEAMMQWEIFGWVKRASPYLTNQSQMSFYRSELFGLAACVTSV